MDFIFVELMAASQPPLLYQGFPRIADFIQLDVFFSSEKHSPLRRKSPTSTSSLKMTNPGRKPGGEWRGVVSAQQNHHLQGPYPGGFAKSVFLLDEPYITGL
jgi:hypothetical protein